MVQVVSSNYPCGPCSYPKKCICGRIIKDSDECDDSECTDGCEVCEYCSTEKCPDCGEHMCCGGCI